MSTSAPPNDRAPTPDVEPVDDDRQAILARRSRFVAAAVVSLTGAAFVNCAACLSPSDPDVRDAATISDGGSDATDARPQPCLSIARDAEPEGDATLDAKSDATPQPCLVPPLPDSGRDE
ncbi:MAG: hypothetical protein U0183_30660 [Polyangiaceae bacterium]